MCTNKRNKTYGREVLFCGLGYAPGVGFLGAGGGKHFSVMVCDNAPSTARSRLNLSLSLYLK